MSLKLSFIAFILVLTIIATVVEPISSEWEPCSNCHPTPTKISPSINPKCSECHRVGHFSRSDCFHCHSEAIFTKEITSRDVKGEIQTITTNLKAIIHKVHVGMSDERFPGYGTSGEHPPTVGECSTCHVRLDCRKCHAEPDHWRGKYCADCHGDLPDPTRTHFTSIPGGSRHAEWSCFTCHDSVEVDAFHLVIKEGLTDNPLDLCYQCHSKQHKAWSDGEHYDGTRPCTADDCHDPHDPYLAPPPPPSHWEWFLAQLTSTIPLLIAIAPLIALLAIAVFLLKRRPVPELPP